MVLLRESCEDHVGIMWESSGNQVGIMWEAPGSLNAGNPAEVYCSHGNSPRLIPTEFPQKNSIRFKAYEMFIFNEKKGFKNTKFSRDFPHWYSRGSSHGNSPHDSRKKTPSGMIRHRVLVTFFTLMDHCAFY